MFLTEITTIMVRAPVVTRSHLLLHTDLMEPLSHSPPPFLLLSRGLVVHYTPAEIQRGIIYSIYSSPPSFFHYIFPFVPFLLPSWIWLCLKSLCKVTSLSTTWNIFRHSYHICKCVKITSYRGDGVGTKKKHTNIVDLNRLPFCTVCPVRALSRDFNLLEPEFYI